jgi:hypothetical protein
VPPPLDPVVSGQSSIWSGLAQVGDALGADRRLAVHSLSVDSGPNEVPGASRARRTAPKAQLSADLAEWRRLSKAVLFPPAYSGLAFGQGSIPGARRVLWSRAERGGAFHWAVDRPDGAPSPRLTRVLPVGTASRSIGPLSGGARSGADRRPRARDLLRQDLRGRGRGAPGAKRFRAPGQDLERIDPGDLVARHA